MVARQRGRFGAGIVSAALLLAFAPAALADGSTVTRGDFAAFATGVGQTITGRAQMVRTADGRTIVTIHVEGLAPNTTFGSHVHKQACADGEADGHYRFDPAGAAMPPNEIWPGPFTTNGDGIGNANTIAWGTAGSTAISVVVHAPGGAKIACADLAPNGPLPGIAPAVVGR
jgi:Cu-Zn family superoxide dismutase